MLIGLDYLHRICKIIHTDLKPENTIVALGNERLEEIVKTGTVKEQKTKSNLIVDNDSRRFYDTTFSKMSTQTSLLTGVDTEGLTK